MRVDGGYLAAGFFPGGADLPARRSPHRHRVARPQCAMIAAVKGWLAVLSALLFILPPGARAADDMGGAARELARKTAAFAGRGETIAITWRNLSGLASS